MEELFIGHHKLEEQVRLHEVELRGAGVGRGLSFGRMVEEQDETLARFVVSFFYLPMETPVLKGVFV